MDVTADLAGQFDDYLNGSALLSTKSSGFAGTETWEELVRSPLSTTSLPAVMAGMLGMLRYDATAVLREINVPALVLDGDRDSVCKPEASERMHSFCGYRALQMNASASR